jgi:hypothetical protein
MVREAIGGAAVEVDGNAALTAHEVVAGGQIRRDVAAESVGADALRKKRGGEFAERGDIAVERKIDGAGGSGAAGASRERTVDEAATAAHALREQAVGMSTVSRDCADLLEPDVAAIAQVARRQRDAGIERVGEHGAAAAADRLQEHAVRAQPGGENVAGVVYGERAAIAACAFAAAERDVQTVDAENIGHATTGAHALENHAHGVIAQGLDVSVEHQRHIAAGKQTTADAAEREGRRERWRGHALRHAPRSTVQLRAPCGLRGFGRFRARREQRQRATAAAHALEHAAMRGQALRRHRARLRVLDVTARFAVAVLATECQVRRAY